MDCYTTAKQNFATRSGFVSRNALFTPEQLTEVYRSIHETLENSCPMTDGRQRYLESAAKQIEQGIPDLEARVEIANQKGMEFACM